jgi:hypothetical protein
VTKKYRPPWHKRKRKEDHHIVPSSRGGCNRDNLLRGFPREDHWAWHKLFGNLTPMEILTVLVKYLFKAGKYRNYRRDIKKTAPATSSMSPDEIILALECQVFSNGWFPSDELMERLEKLRIERKRES